MNQEDIFELIIDDDDNIIDTEGWFDVFYFEYNNKSVYHYKRFFITKYLLSPLPQFSPPLSYKPPFKVLKNNKPPPGGGAKKRICGIFLARG